jgi:DNA-directed RNA polymerase subunit RPC12/RpoP
MSSVKSGPYKGTRGVEIRCLECLARIDVAPKAKEVECPNCGTKYLIYWPTPDIAKIKGVAQERLP